MSILISQYAGAKESDKVVSICGTSITFIYIIGIPVGILGWFAAPYILEFMKVPQDVWNAALIYTRLVFLGTLGNLGYNMNAGTGEIAYDPFISSSASTICSVSQRSMPVTNL